MRGNLYLKIAFVVVLSVVLLFLIFIIYDKAGKRTGIYEPPALADYIIVDLSEDCKKGEELIYEDEKYSYYLPCLSSYDIYLEWTDGARDLIKNAINNNKVTIDSLIEHGLKVIKHEK